MRQLILLLFFLPIFALAQTPEANQLVMIHNVANLAAMNSITNPNSGSLLYVTEEKAMFYFDGNSWKQQKAISSIVFNRENVDNILQTDTNKFYNFPIDASHVQVNQGSVFTVLADGKIRVNEAGVYQLSASLSTKNLPSGNTKYILAVNKGSTLIGYLSRGSVNLPSLDFWGTSGTLAYLLSANDIITFRYVINGNGSKLNAAFVNASITKL